MDELHQFEVIIIGGSYAGISAALALGRARRKTLIIDSGNPCNWRTPHAHNFITHDGEVPANIARKARKQVAMYPSVQLLKATVAEATGTDGKFRVTTSDGTYFAAKKLLFATGVKDQPMPIRGFAECWGITVLHCPYCHGYEVRDEPLGIIASTETAFEFAQLILHWSANLTLFTNGASPLDGEQHARLKAHGVHVEEQEIEAILHQDGYMQHVLLRDGRQVALTAVFARSQTEQHCTLPAEMGCELLTEGFYKGLIKVDEFGKTTVPGIYAAGDNVIPFRSVALAVAAGNKAGPFINLELIKEEF